MYICIYVKKIEKKKIFKASWKVKKSRWCTYIDNSHEKKLNIMTAAGSMAQPQDSRNTTNCVYINCIESYVQWHLLL